MGNARNEAKPGSALAVLAPEQASAVDLLLAGRSHVEAGDEVGQGRETIDGWHDEPLFAAALNQRRQRMWGEQEDRLRSLLPRAMAVVEAALDRGDERTALAVLKLAGLGRVNFAEVGPTTAEGVEVQAQRRQLLDMYR